MFSKQLNRFALGAAMVVVLGLMTPALGLAAGPTGSSPSAPLAVNSQMKHLDIGGQDWYAFTTAGKDSSNAPSHVLIDLKAVPDGSATFKVWTAEGLKEQDVEDSSQRIHAMGQGTQLPYKNGADDGGDTLYRYGGDLVWSNGFKVGGTFYVQVGQAGSTASNYLLTIAGDNISFPANATAASQGQSAQAAPPAVTNSAIPAEIVPGSGMSTAMTPNGQLKTLSPGAEQWYAVTLSRPVNKGDTQNLNVELNAPAGAATFSVWTAQRLAEHAASDDPNKKAPAIGQGTVASYQHGGKTVNLDNGYLTWSGDASNGGTLYIVVQSTSSAPVQYELNANVTQR